MTVSEKAKEKLDEASKEIKEAIDNVKLEVAELTNKVKEKLKGAGEEMRESAEELTREVKGLSEKVKDLIPKRRKKNQWPVRIDKYPDFQPDVWEQPFLELRKATDRLFDDFFRGFRWPIAERRSPWALTTDVFATDWPRADMDETDEEIRITAELPGVDKDNIDVSVTEDMITIRGEKKDQEEKKGRGYYKLERSYGSFQRSFYLPCEVESDSVDASFKDGVLTVKLPKSAAARERIKKIPIRTG
ncbi:MAG: Hsp20 family protein [Deltaproteobacteria bacterium]|nr:Hsp20 family protein [Deltaproteobacteria bacterium]MBW1794880.1 Hsp20 family protein [Deltaproteobacteria bacterium]